MSKNKIQELTVNSFKGLESLEYLGIFNIYRILLFSNISKIKLKNTIDLSNNCIKSISNGSFIDLKNLNFLGIKMNCYYIFHINLNLIKFIVEIPK